MNLSGSKQLDKRQIITGLLRVFFFLYLLFYAVLFAGYFVFVGIVHSSFSLISVPATILPYLFLLSLLWVLWKGKTVEERQAARKRIRMVSILGLIPVVLLLVVLGKNEVETTFDPIRWQTQHDMRVYMVDDMLAKHHLIGLHKKEVIQLLGETKAWEYFKEDNNIVYYLGPERGLVRIDSEWLVIWFDAHEKVTSYELKRD
ncbi:hypothetical protein [Brevibacillus sp. SYSU BS000544]|uniref:hypothetical protein n=1 Tax=Brevibacillus sp. SYSU BS000544 TaxID=3416443 RepID=UPI003CE4B457